MTVHHLGGVAILLVGSRGRRKRRRVNRGEGVRGEG